MHPLIISMYWHTSVGCVVLLTYLKILFLALFESSKKGSIRLGIEFFNRKKNGKHRKLDFNSLA